MNTKLVRKELYDDDYVMNEQEYKGKQKIPITLFFKSLNKNIPYFFSLSQNSTCPKSIRTGRQGVSATSCLWSALATNLHSQREFRICFSTTICTRNRMPNSSR